MTSKVTAIVPAYNEADLIGLTIRAIREIPCVSEVIVVDDGSTDSTGKVASAAGASRVISLPRNVGKGGALNVALKECDGEILLILDADLGPSAAEGKKLLDVVLGDMADMAIGIPSGTYPETAMEVPALRPKSGGFGFVVKVARFGINLLTGRRMQAPLAGPRALRREIVERAGGFDSRFGVEVGLTIDALNMGYRVVEVPIDMVHRGTGRDIRGFRHRASQLWDVLNSLMRRAIRR